MNYLAILYSSNEQHFPFTVKLKNIIIMMQTGKSFLDAKLKLDKKGHELRETKT